MERVRWLVDVARALAAAHKAGLVHRDVKPENVIVRDDGCVKVLDFGIARRIEGSNRLTRTGIVVGTPGYMAPEQARGESAVGVAADVYALGALLSFLGGDAPPRALAAMVARARAPRPEDRYPSVGALQEDVARFLSDLPVSAYAERPLEQVRRLATKYRTPLVLVLAYLVMRVLLAFVARV